MKRKNIVKLTLVMLIWAFSWVVLKFTLREVPPFSLAFLRFLIASPVIFLLTLITRGRKKLKICWREIPTYLVLGVTGVGALHAVEFIGLKYTSPINASLLVNLSVIFIALFAFLFLRENLGKKGWLGIGISFLGVFLLVSKGAIFTFMGEETFRGDLLFIASSFFWTIYTLLGKKFLEKKDILVVITYAFIFGTLSLVPFALYENTFSLISEISVFSWLSIIYLAIFCSIIAYMFWFQTIKEEGASKVAAFLYLIPLLTAIFSTILLKEGLTLFIFFGGALIIYGVYLTESSKNASFESKKK